MALHSMPPAAARLRVAETFVSIQGESSHAGRPCFFIRLAGCNLRCAWCDTRWAQSARGVERCESELVADYAASGLALVEVTGGEPLCQAGTPALLAALRDAVPGGTVLVETNGSLDVSVIPAGVTAIMDVKCPSSGESGAMDWANLERLRPQDEVKFVVADRADFDWAARLIRARGLAGRCGAVLVGAVSGRLDPALLARWLIEDRVPARLNVQLHARLGLR